MADRVTAPGDGQPDPRLLALARDVESARRESGIAVAAAASANQTAESALRHAARSDEELREQLRTIRRLVDELDDHLRQVPELSARVTTLSEQVEQFVASMGSADSEDESPRPVSWFEVDAPHAAALLTQLIEWVDTVLVRYRAGREMLPECWVLHPELVEELLWLHRAWCAAYRDPDARASTAGDWHERWLPGVHRRQKWVKDCRFSAHFGEPDRSSPGGRERADLVELAKRPLVLTSAQGMDEFAQWWSQTRGRNPDDRPPAIGDQQVTQPEPVAVDGGRSQPGAYNEPPAW